MDKIFLNTLNNFFLSCVQGTEGKNEFKTVIVNV